AGARVFVDGRYTGQTPVDLDLVVGRRSLRLQREGYRDVVRRVEARAGDTDRWTVQLVPLPREELERQRGVSPWYEEPVTWVLVGAAALVVAAGVVALVSLTAD